jgi:hypothetical protein
VEVHHGAVEAHHGAVHCAVEAHHDALEAHYGAVVLPWYNYNRFPVSDTVITKN